MILDILTTLEYFKTGEKEILGEFTAAVNESQRLLGEETLNKLFAFVLSLISFSYSLFYTVTGSIYYEHDVIVPFMLAVVLFISTAVNTYRCIKVLKYKKFVITKLDKLLMPVSSAYTLYFIYYYVTN
ncbi:hypothetical protein JOC37_001286 [Desulfohalotomaculum tongense]|uniref:hypothetical protein n=1 Tax=Desulforadius tongensis TaxID=1216062 RepID=UPI00195BC27F|nr:hypothetical protein [Desulforadius tongensis]MBM7854906.1 hypothetical protein [Desulforadius tongensis]